MCAANQPPIRRKHSSVSMQMTQDLARGDLASEQTANVFRQVDCKKVLTEQCNSYKQPDVHSYLSTSSSASLGLIFEDKLE